MKGFKTKNIYTENFQVQNFGHVLQLRSELIFANMKKPGFPVSPICLPEGEETPIDEYCYATGWGFGE